MRLFDPICASLWAAPLDAAASSGIPFRTDASISMDRFTVAMLMVSLALAALIFCIYLARRKGWLDGKFASVNRHANQAAKTGVEIRSSKRISMATTVHVVAYREREFIVIESGRGVSSHITQLDGTERDGEGQS